MLKERLLAELKLPEVTDFADFALHKQLRENLDRSRELLTGRHIEKARQVLRRLLGPKNVLWFAPQLGRLQRVRRNPNRTSVRRDT
jgi:peptidoglycan/xylan/chitin deacetylase (PgdA/CDA1 family)